MLRNRHLPVSIGISEVERNTGVRRENLRSWERRYGFPLPVRDANGDRTYSREEVDKIFQIKRLMDTGYRPNTLMGLTRQHLLGMGLERELAVESQNPPTQEVAAILQALTRGDVRTFQKLLRWQLSAFGTHRFVVELVANLAHKVGDLWSEGKLPIYLEHIFTEQIEAILRAAMAQHVIEPIGPRILLATLPGERHKLGLLMLETLLSVELTDCISLGTGLPVTEIADAALETGARVVALSFSAAFSAKAAVESLTHLRAQLPSEIVIWAGGACVTHLRKRPAGVRMPMSLESAVSELRKLRQ